MAALAAQEHALEEERKALQAERTALVAKKEAILAEAKEVVECDRKQLANQKKALDEAREQLKQDVAEWKAVSTVAGIAKEYQDDTITLRVGGVPFETTRTTLSMIGGTFFVALLNWNTQKTSFFIDRDPTHFQHILNILRGAHVPTAILDNPSFIDELKFYGLGDRVHRQEESEPVVDVFGEIATENDVSNGCREQLVEKKIVEITTSSESSDSISPKFIIDISTSGFFCTDGNVPGSQCIVIQFKAHRVRPIFYEFEVGRRFKMSNWDFDASNNGVDWTTIRVHRNVSHKEREAIWLLDSKSKEYTHFRIKTTGPSKEGSDSWPIEMRYLQIFGYLSPLKRPRDD
jgi:hypothetical protein